MTGEDEKTQETKSPADTAKTPEPVLRPMTRKHAKKNV